MVLDPGQLKELEVLAKEKKCILMSSLRTAYATAYMRLLLLIKSGMIGQVKLVEATCTSLKNKQLLIENNLEEQWNSICEWGPTAMLPVFQILGTKFIRKTIASNLLKENPKFDLFTKIDFVFPSAVASIQVGQGVKSEGSLIIAGTEGYIYALHPRHRCPRLGHGLQLQRQAAQRRSAAVRGWHPPSDPPCRDAARLLCNAGFPAPDEAAV